MSEEEKMSEEEMTEKPTEEEVQDDSDVPSWASLGLDSRILAGLGKNLIYPGNLIKTSFNIDGQNKALTR